MAGYRRRYRRSYGSPYGRGGYRRGYGRRTYGRSTFRARSKPVGSFRVYARPKQPRSMITRGMLIRKEI